MIKPLEAGHLHQKVTVEKAVETTATDGQKLRATWSDLIPCRFASVVTVSGGEKFWSGLQVQVETRLLVRMWSDEHSRQITNNMRIVWQGKKYGITRVYDPDNRRRELAIECKDQQ